MKQWSGLFYEIGREKRSNNDIFKYDV